MPTNIRHRILFAEPGTGMRSGQAIIDDVIKIERAAFASSADLHQVRSPEGYAIIDKYASIYAWQLRDVTRLSVQRPFKHNHGSIIWVRSRASEANAAAETYGTNASGAVAITGHKRRCCIVSDDEDVLRAPPKRRASPAVAITGYKRRCCSVSEDEAPCGGLPKQNSRSMRPSGAVVEEGVPGSGRRAFSELPAQRLVWKQALWDALSRKSRAMPLADLGNHPASSSLHEVAADKKQEEE